MHGFSVGRAEQLHQGDRGLVSTSSTDNNGLSLRKKVMLCQGRRDHISADYLVMK